MQSKEKCVDNKEQIPQSEYRDKAIAELKKELNEENLWEAFIAFQHYPFRTASGLEFQYEIKRGRYGQYTRELLVDRRADSKTLAWSSVMLALRNAIAHDQIDSHIVERPKALGDIRGISYIYPVFYHLGLIQVPEEIAVKMKGER